MLLWKRRGMLVTPRGDARWRTHAQLPTALPLRDDCWRIYFCARDDRNRSHTFAVDVNPRDNMRVVAEHFGPLLEPGPTGAFDAAGAGPCSALMVDQHIHLYYAAYTARSDVPVHCAIGLAASDDGIAFNRIVSGPVLATGPYDPFYVSTPFVRRIDSGYEMWYQSTTGWTGTGKDLEPTYTLRRTESPDGIVWNPATTPALDANTLAAANYTRPWIVERANQARLWFSRRGTDFRNGGSGAYRIFSAPLAADGKRAGAPVEEVQFENPPRAGEWDDQMQAYACIVPLDDGLVMFYNGNEFGQHGFGWATAG